MVYVGWSATDRPMAWGRSNANCLQKKILSPLATSITSTDFKYSGVVKSKITNSQKT